jgi:hypothetical protein
MTCVVIGQVRNKGTYSVVQYFLRLVEARRTRRLDLSQQDLDTVPIEVRSKLGPSRLCVNCGALSRCCLRTVLAAWAKQNSKRVNLLMFCCETLKFFGNEAHTSCCFCVVLLYHWKAHSILDDAITRFPKFHSLCCSFHCRCASWTCSKA